MGLHVGDTEAVLEQVLSQQSHLQEREIADVVLDTAGESAEAITQLLRTLFGPGSAT